MLWNLVAQNMDIPNMTEGLLAVKNPGAHAGDAGDLDSVPGLGRSPRGGNGNQLQYSHLENPKDRGVWQGCKESDLTKVT